jgi:hypothetical protein
MAATLRIAYVSLISIDHQVSVTPIFDGLGIIYGGYL